RGGPGGGGERGGRLRQGEHQARRRPHPGGGGGGRARGRPRPRAGGRHARGRGPEGPVRHDPRLSDLRGDRAARRRSLSAQPPHSAGEEPVRVAVPAGARDRGGGGAAAARRRRVRPALGVAGLVAAHHVLPVGEWTSAFQSWVARQGVWGGVVYGVVYAVAALAFVPGSLLTIGAGFAFGLLWGTVIVSIASTTAAALAFLIAR